jgi:hypothetical protein
MNLKNGTRSGQLERKEEKTFKPGRRKRIVAKRYLADRMELLNRGMVLNRDDVRYERNNNSSYSLSGRGVS